MTQMRISADNDYADDRGGIKVGAVVNVRPYESITNPHLTYEFENPDKPGEWLWCEARELEEIPEDETSEIEALTEHYADIIEQKNKALTVAAFVFGQYAENHFAKGTPESIMKAITNVGLEGMMLDALEAD